MKKSILTLVTILFLALGSIAQTDITLPSGNTIKGGSGNAGIITIDAFGNGEIILNDKTTIRGNSYTSGHATFGQTAIFQSGATMSNTRITNLAKAISDGDAVNLGQLKEYINNQPSNLDKATIIKEANAYTDKEVKRLDNKIDAVDSKVTALDNKITSEFKRVDTKIETEVNRLDSKIEKNDAAIRRDLRTETDRLTRADAQLFAEMSGLGATMMAMGSMQSSAVYSPNKKGNISMGSGVYRDSFAYAASVSYYVNPNTRISSTVAGGTKTKVGGGLGVSFGF